MRPPSPIPMRLLVAWAIFIVYGTTLPFDQRPGLDTVLEGWNAAHKVPWQNQDGGRASLSDVVANVLLFLPWGFLLGLHLAERRRRLWSTLLLGGGTALAMSGLVEFLQLFSSTRTSSATDLITNTVGGTAGALVGWQAAVRFRLSLGPWLRSLIRREPLTALAGATALGVLLWATSPFDVSIDVGDLKDSFKSVRPIPFGAPIRGDVPVESPWKPVAGVLAWCALGGLATLAARARGMAHPRRAAWGFAALLAVAAELSQLLIRSHATDATTVLFSWIGLSLGVAVVGRRPERPAVHWAVPALTLWAVSTVVAGLSPWDLAPPTFEGWTLMRALPFIHYFLRTDVYALADATLQILLYLPAGFLLSSRPHRTSLLIAAGLGAAVALTVEIGQLFVVGRVADITDVALGGIGGAIGAGIWSHAMRVREESAQGTPDSLVED